MSTTGKKLKNGRARRMFDIPHSKQFLLPSLQMTSFPSSHYEIVILECTDVYGTWDVSSDNVVQEFIDLCRKYVNPEDVNREDVCLSNTRNLISYSDISGNDKPRTVMLIGSNIPFKIYEEIDDKLEEFYMAESESESDSDDC
jgi:hypothetical protein